ncbi:MAG: sugar O-acetyltransferase [Candidatus Methanomethylophilaceae archaeon]|nr:sugar O-acetyltransferase [Candidatus Methanomethylophilaceae archaeon]MDY5872811.1 sugar O-acetyltransferase [Candidatus Methanomethylophilaceae archaeon]
MSVRDRLERGEWVGMYDDDIEEYDRLIGTCYEKMTRLNTTVTDRQGLRDMVSDIVGYELDKDTVVIAPFRCDLGFNVILGKKVLVNYNCTFLDTARISVGDNTMIGPNCQFVTAVHPMVPEDRRDRKVRGEPITIGADCWFGAGAIVLPGVTIGNGCVIGAGSVVTRDVPDNTTVVGNPAHPIIRKNN